MCNSFISNTSFVAFPSLGQRRDVRLTFDLRSPSPTGVILFNSGGQLDSDFIAVELVGGRVTLRVNKGAGAIVMMSLSQVDDGAWHQVGLPVHLSITVDTFVSEFS
jgi:agrin